MERGVATYPGVRTEDGVRGGHVMLMPPYTVGRGEVEEIVRVLVEVVEEVFKEI